MKATQQATIEAYMELVKTQGDVETFLNECFGTEEDFDNKACDTFADEVQPVLQEFLDSHITDAPAPEQAEGAIEMATNTTQPESEILDVVKEDMAAACTAVETDEA